MSAPCLVEPDVPILTSRLTTSIQKHHTQVNDRYDSDYPLEVDDDCWPGELLADPIDHWKQPAGVPAKVTAWVLFLKLMDIYSFAQQTIYSVRRAEFWDSLSTVEWDHNVAVVLDSALNKWLEAIPDHCEFFLSSSS